jgi:hypothetical protein
LVASRHPCGELTHPAASMLSANSVLVPLGSMPTTAVRSTVPVRLRRSTV